MNKIDYVKSQEELEEIMGRYGFRESEPPKCKYRVFFGGKETVLNQDELNKLGNELGPYYMPIVSRIYQSPINDSDAWKELIRVVKHAWEYGIHSNDMTLGEIEEDISGALNRFAKAMNLPQVNWEEENVVN